jgi:hypothetical protein
MSRQVLEAAGRVVGDDDLRRLNWYSRCGKLRRWLLHVRVCHTRSLRGTRLAWGRAGLHVESGLLGGQLFWVGLVVCQPGETLDDGRLRTSLLVGNGGSSLHSGVCGSSQSIDLRQVRLWHVVRDLAFVRGALVAVVSEQRSSNHSPAASPHAFNVLDPVDQRLARVRGELSRARHSRRGTTRLCRGLHSGVSGQAVVRPSTRDSWRLVAGERRRVTGSSTGCFANRVG